MRPLECLGSNGRRDSAHLNALSVTGSVSILDATSAEACNGRRRNHIARQRRMGSNASRCLCLLGEHATVLHSVSVLSEEKLLLMFCREKQDQSIACARQFVVIVSVCPMLASHCLVFCHNNSIRFVFTFHGHVEYLDTNEHPCIEGYEPTCTGFASWLIRDVFAAREV